MRWVTLNTWGTRGPEARRSILLEALRSLDPEILCLQEVTDRKLLDDLHYPACLHAPTSGLAILSRFPVKNHRIQTYKTLSPFEPYARQALLAQLQLATNPLWIVSTHLAWKKEDGATRLSQVKELLKLVAPLGKDLLLSGDFNTEPFSPPIQQIVNSGFLDLWNTFHKGRRATNKERTFGDAREMVSGPEDPGMTWDNRNPFIQSHAVKFPDRRIDYLFLHQAIAPTLHPIGCEVVFRTPSPQGLYPSDHYGVMATFKRADGS